MKRSTCCFLLVFMPVLSGMPFFACAGETNTSTASPHVLHAQPQAVADQAQRLRTIKGLELRISRLLGMVGKKAAFMSAWEEEATPFSRESYKTPGELASSPEADKLYAAALKLNRVADDMIAGGKGDTALNPWKRHTPEDLAERIRFTYDLCEAQQKCLSDEMQDIEKMIRWMQKDVENGNMTLADFVDMSCQMIDRFLQVVTTEPLPAERFVDISEFPDMKQARMLQVRVEKLMQLTFQKRAFLNAARRQIEDINALIRDAQKAGETPGLKKAMDIAAGRLIAIADDILARGDGTTGRKPWKQFTPEDLSDRIKQLDPFSDHETGFSAMDEDFRQMTLQVNTGRLSVGDFVDEMCRRIDSLIAKQNRPAKPATKKTGVRKAG